MQGLLPCRNYNKSNGIKEFDEILKANKVMLALTHSRIYVK